MPKFVLIFLIISSYLEVSVAQRTKSNYAIKLNMRIGYNNQIGTLTRFPFELTNASITPTSVSSDINYEYNLALHKFLSEQWTIGLSLNIGEFSFTEFGDLLNFWTNTTSEYSRSREFKFYGVELNTSFDFWKNKTKKLTFCTGILYEQFSNASEMYLWIHEYNRLKFASNNLIEFSQNLTDSISLTLGTYFKTALNDYHDFIDFRPSRFGISVGAHFYIN